MYMSWWSRKTEPIDKWNRDVTHISCILSFFFPFLLLFLSPLSHWQTWSLQVSLFSKSLQGLMVLSISNLELKGGLDNMEFRLLQALKFFHRLSEGSLPHSELVNLCYSYPKMLIGWQLGWYWANILASLTSHMLSLTYARWPTMLNWCERTNGAGLPWVPVLSAFTHSPTLWAMFRP